MLAVQDVISLTSVRFPDFGTGSPTVEPLEKGGSDRKFYRIRMGGDSMIFIKYSNHKEENRHYVAIARFLTKAGVPVPEVYLHDEEESLIWMQDLGEVDLWSHRNDAWPTRRALYQSTLDAVFAMHRNATAADGVGDLELQRVFDTELYLWEQGYFFEHCLGNFFKTDAGELAELASLPALRGAAERLASLPRVLVHRDFQSQNVMIRQGSAWLIDFQGMRYGLAQYDLASLLYDPYVSLHDGERGELLDYYKSLCGVVSEDFDEIFRWCAVQRLMQALGAYGFLGLQKGRSEFLTHVPVALRSLLKVVSGLDGLDPLVQKLEELT
jgi:aminoglycoside/choline kinase family phosphotransferase